AFTPEAWVAAAAEHHITHAMVVPTMLGRVLDVMESTGITLPDLRHLSYGGGRMPIEVVERAMQMLPDTGFVNAYGLTETASTIAVLGPDDHRDAMSSDDPVVRRRLGSVGRPTEAIEVSIRDDLTEPVAVGEPGEIWVRGDQVSGEYVGRESRAIDGWFPTNDGGWLDEGGYLYITGRLDDVIVRGGENISPGEIEDVLRMHPDVADVAVVGVPSQEWGEEIAAVVVVRPDTNPDPAELAAFVRERLRSTKQPTTIRIMDELPYNETGKLLRRVVRQVLTNSD
ncbi:MAG: fatty acid--CoA ligase family protein, partial [Ilumatobacteraceae bacterium]